MAGSIIPDLAAAGFFPDTVIVNRCTGADDRGNRTYSSTAETIACRISGKTASVTSDETSEETSSKLHLVTAGAFGLSSKDKFTLPAKFSRDFNATGGDALRARQPKAILVTVASDENGPHHEKVYF